MFSAAAMSSVSKNAPSSQVQLAYVVFAAAAFMVYHMIAEGEFSAILTMAVMMQCLGFVLLAVQMLSTGSAEGISARALMLDGLALCCRLSSTLWLNGYLPVDATGDWIYQAGGISARALMLDGLALCCRLSSTLWLNGYLPVDATGDWIYQAVDIVSLILVGWLLHRVLVDKRASYQEDEDNFSMLPMTLACFVMAGLLHADMNSRPLFDAFWMAGLFVSVVAVLPQLWLIARTGGRVEALTSHYIAAMALSRALSGSFMWHARFDITCDFWVEGYNHAIWAILAAHAAHMLLLGDFAYYYIKNIVRWGFTGRMEIGDESV